MDLKTNFKTPVSILLEVGTMLETQAMFLEAFNVNNDESSKGRFHCKVIFQEYTTSGSGSTKKEAKQDCAKAMVLLLRETNEKFKEIIDKVCKDGTIPESALTDNEKAPTNSVMDLANLCISKSIPPPTYKLLKEQGPPHAKLFTMSCALSNFVLKASATTKKQCKQLVASMMLQSLSDKTLAELPDNKHEYSAVDSFDFCDLEFNLFDQYYYFHLESETLDELVETYENEAELEEELKTKNAYHLLHRILEESETPHGVKVYPSQTAHMIVGIEIITNTLCTCYTSVSESYEKGLQASSVKAILMFYTLNEIVDPELAYYYDLFDTFS